MKDIRGRKEETVGGNKFTEKTRHSDRVKDRKRKGKTDKEKLGKEWNRKEYEGEGEKENKTSGTKEDERTEIRTVNERKTKAEKNMSSN